ncbi:hypothetical protein WKV44_03715 [Spirochaetia bacterium 38H-sp]|uniref:Uncharacterized protein n=1 Tax=Rarispira pelagica TaxID=3141764 RepID=A0ABU9UAE8_9SPIR
MGNRQERLMLDDLSCPGEGYLSVLFERLRGKHCFLSAMIKGFADMCYDFSIFSIFSIFVCVL